jgi:hypothetical protein
MRLRDHPQISYGGVSTWPPVWNQRAYVGLPNTPTIKGEVGFLSRIVPGSGGKDLFLQINHEGNEYIGCLFIDDPTFRNQMHQFLTECIGMSIKDIGDSDLSHFDST